MCELTYRRDLLEARGYSRVDAELIAWYQLDQEQQALKSARAKVFRTQSLAQGRNTAKAEAKQLSAGGQAVKPKLSSMCSQARNPGFVPGFAAPDKEPIRVSVSKKKKKITFPVLKGQ